MGKIAFIGIIPARYASTRFPGKPLALIGGKPMIERVYEQAQKSLDKVIVATDDERIYDCVLGFGGEAMMTRTDHRCGTERCAEVAENLDRFADRIQTASLTEYRQDVVIINIQGDEPFIQPDQIEALKGCFADADTQIATLVKPFTSSDSIADLENPNSPKVAVSPDGHALLFSRSVIPYLRGIEKSEWLQRGTFYKHIGMYAYRSDVLQQIVKLAPTPLEQAESLEQLRWIENGYTIKVAVCESASIGIDTPSDLEKANEFLKKY